MATEHAFLGAVAPSLETALIGARVGAGVEKNRWGLIGYGAISSHGTGGHTHTVGSGDFGTSAEFVTATGSLITNGGLEDGYEAIQFGLDNYTFRAAAAVNIVLVTDEDRDNFGANALTQAGILNGLTSVGALLNAIVNNPFTDAGASTALGLSGTPTNTVVNSFTADGSGGFVKAAGGTVGNGSGLTETDYVTLAFNTGGAAWDLNQLRVGGATADSFTAAFIDIKVEEIVAQQPLPEPGTMLLFGSGLIGLTAWRRYKTNV